MKILDLFLGVLSLLAIGIVGILLLGISFSILWPIFVFGLGVALFLGAIYLFFFLYAIIVTFFVGDYEEKAEDHDNCNSSDLDEIDNEVRDSDSTYKKQSIHYEEEYFSFKKMFKIILIWLSIFFVVLVGQISYTNAKNKGIIEIFSNKPELKIYVPGDESTVNYKW